jgi:hypothetical protein
MRNSKATAAARHAALAATLVAALVCGCQSKQEKALDQARKRAAATGQAQQVVSVDKKGVTTTTVVQPPKPGTTQEAVTTTRSNPTPGQPAPPPSAPEVSAVPQAPQGPVSVDVPAGTELAVRIDHSLSARADHSGEKFGGEVVTPVTASDGSAVIPKGAAVEGEVVEARRGGRFKGASVLELKLISLTVDGTNYRVSTRGLERASKGKGKRSARMIAGGSGLGMLIGGITHGPVGLAVGGLVGGGAGTVAAGTTGKRNVVIPAESVVDFTLAKDVTVEEKG